MSRLAKCHRGPFREAEDAPQSGVGRMPPLTSRSLLRCAVGAFWVGCLVQSTALALPTGVRSAEILYIKSANVKIAIKSTTPHHEQEIIYARVVTGAFDPVACQSLGSLEPLDSGWSKARFIPVDLHCAAFELVRLTDEEVENVRSTLDKPHLAAQLSAPDSVYISPGIAFFSGDGPAIELTANVFEGPYLLGIVGRKGLAREVGIQAGWGPFGAELGASKRDAKTDPYLAPFIAIGVFAVGVHITERETSAVGWLKVPILLYGRSAADAYSIVH